MPKTLTVALDNSAFPSLPEYGARWYPLLFKPVADADECLTVAICIRGADGEVCVTSTIESRRLKHFFGDRSLAVGDMINVCLRSARVALEQRVNFDQWIPPIANFVLGDGRDALADNLDDVLIQAARLSTAIGFHLGQIEAATVEEEVTTRRNEKWTRKIRDTMRYKQKALANSFDREVKLTGARFEQKIGFLTPNYAAHFSVFSPGASAVRVAVRVAQSRLWQLDRIRDASSEPSVKHVELVVGHQDFESGLLDDDEVAEVCDALEEVRQEASRRDINLFDASIPEVVVDHLCEMVAA